LCTEHNAKCCLGLQGLVVDGWNIGLVIAFVPDRNRRPTRLLLGLVRKFLLLLEKYVFGGNNVKLIPFNSCGNICGTMGISYVSTSDSSLTSVTEDLRLFSPDVILSNGWSFKINSSVSELSNIVSLNCHSSYLPDYRGGNVTYAPLINCEEKSGVTVHELTEKFDSGRILAQCRVFIDRRETTASLNAKRAMVTPGILIEALHKVGDERLYKRNPPSPFYFRCSYERYMYLRLINLVREKFGYSCRKFDPKLRYDL
jgi:hypothetical protein